VPGLLVGLLLAPPSSPLPPLGVEPSITGGYEILAPPAEDPVDPVTGLVGSGPGNVLPLVGVGNAPYPPQSREVTSLVSAFATFPVLEDDPGSKMVPVKPAIDTGSDFITDPAVGDSADLPQHSETNCCDVTPQQSEPIPEPPMLLLFAFAVVLLIYRRQT
jgi:hypothetical protein